MTAAVDREKWGVVPFALACHCQNCDLVSAAPNGRCAQCGSESVAPLRREERTEGADAVL
jgi:hypothetical protein